MPRQRPSLQAGHHIVWAVRIRILGQDLNQPAMALCQDTHLTQESLSRVGQIMVAKVLDYDLLAVVTPLTNVDISVPPPNSKVEGSRPEQSSRSPSSSRIGHAEQSVEELTPLIVGCVPNVFWRMSAPHRCIDRKVEIASRARRT